MQQIRSIPGSPHLVRDLVPQPDPAAAALTLRGPLDLEVRPQRLEEGDQLALAELARVEVRVVGVEDVAHAADVGPAVLAFRVLDGAAQELDGLLGRGPGRGTAVALAPRRPASGPT